MENQHRKITGYRELDDAEIAKLNEIKAIAQQVGDLVDAVAGIAAGSDGRWVAIGRTHLQQGFMALARAIAKPTTF